MNTNTSLLREVHPALVHDDGSPRVVIIILLAIGAHFLVWLIRFVSDWLIRKSASRKMPVGFVTGQPKFITLTGLVSSALAFVIYFFALGFILSAFGVDLTAYLATASVVGLAVGFGSQGLVQDVVTGLTLILSNVLDVGDMIEVNGQIGRVEKVGLRFTQLSNFFNQHVFVPNRMIGNIARFPAGGVYAYADVQVPAAADRQKVAEIVDRISKGMWREFNAIILEEPEVSEIETVDPGGWSFVRTAFKIWPGQGLLLEITFRQRVTSELKALEPTYVDWMVPVTYRAWARPKQRTLDLGDGKD